MKHGLIILLVATLLSGCAGKPLHKPSSELVREWSAINQDLLKLDDWKLTGRIAIRTEGEALNGNIQWQQHQDTFDIHIYGPFGKGSVKLMGDALRVVLANAQGDNFYAQDPEQLLYEQLGLKIPISNLFHWLLGRPLPGTLPENLSLDAQGRISQLEQDTWVITYRSYTRSGQYDLPKKIYIKNHQLSVRLVIDQWDIPSS